MTKLRMADAVFVQVHPGKAQRRTLQYLIYDPERVKCLRNCHENRSSIIKKI